MMQTDCRQKLTGEEIVVLVGLNRYFGIPVLNIVAPGADTFVLAQEMVNNTDGYRMDTTTFPMKGGGLVSLTLTRTGDSAGVLELCYVPKEESRTLDTDIGSRVSQLPEAGFKVPSALSLLPDPRRFSSWTQPRLVILLPLLSPSLNLMESSV
jgi:hypothetical protein